MSSEERHNRQMAQESGLIQKRLGRDLYFYDGGARDFEISQARKRSYVQNFPAILNYLERHDGIDVSEIREMYRKQVEDNRKNPFYKDKSELLVKAPGPTIERKLAQLVESTKKEELSNDVDRGIPTYILAMKYYKDTVLSEILKQQRQILEVKHENLIKK